MEIKTEEVFHNGDAPFNRIHAAVGVYQNTGQGHQDSLNRYIYSSDVLRISLLICPA